MKNHRLRILLSGSFAATVLAVAVGAQAPPPASSAPAVKSAKPAPVAPMAPMAPVASQAPMPGHDKHSAAGAQHEGDMGAECKAMMVKKQEMHEKMQAMDASLDKLVEEMNFAKQSKAVGAMDKPMAAVINELVSQRKAARAMMMETQHGMMGHMGHHAKMDGSGGGMECPMMKMDHASAPMTGEMKPKP